jgi:hypothetical protein
MCVLSYLSYLAFKPHLLCWVWHCHLWPVCLYHFFPISTHTRHNFWKKSIAYKMSLQFFLQILSDIHTILRRIQQDIIINVHRPLCKIPFIFIRCQWNLNSHNRFSKNTQISNIMEIRSTGAESGGRTDRHGASDSPFSQFCEGA